VKILLVEDDEPTAAALLTALKDDRHVVNLAADGQMGLSLAESYDYDLVVLDVLVPKLDGISICRQLRAQGQQMPILLLTAKDSQTDKILGLDAGADDYVVKPFDLEELRARIRALLRRSRSPFSSLLTWENLSLDPVANDVTYNHQPIALTPKEFGILELLLRNPHRVFSRSAIIDRLWGLEDSPAESAVTTHIKDLRQKLKSGGVVQDLIETVYGLGYRLKPPSTPPQASTSQPASSIAPFASPAAIAASTVGNSANKTIAPPPVNTPAELTELQPTETETASSKNTTSLDRVLNRFRHTFIEQVEVLDQFATTLRTQEITAKPQEQARQEAHKLSGSLGIFGYPQGSHVARSIEQQLAHTTNWTPEAIEQFINQVTALRQELSDAGKTDLGKSDLGKKAPATAEIVETLRSNAPTTHTLITDSPNSNLSTPSPSTPNNGASNGIHNKLPNGITPPRTTNGVVRPLPSAFSQLRRQPISPPCVLVVNEDTTLTEQLQSIALHHGLFITSAPTPTAARQVMSQTFPDLVLLDLIFAEATEDGFTFLAELTHQYPTVPVLVFTGRDSLDDRVEVSRLGGKAFLSKSMPIEQILQAIHQALTTQPSSEAKVLIVDDDEAVLAALSNLLRPWGLNVITLRDPQQFWETLITSQPDVVVVDLEMPKFSGIDLCQVVRHDPQWGDLPILVVTAHTDADSIRKVFNAGADDFISKPVVGPELVTRILSRIERVRSRQTLH
jgi:DNA-binding response OmpR family regulator/HPt (histidine-containing phosphotransfer) domain-containing protein